MKIASTVARYLLGLMFTVFGLNGFLHFIPAPMPTGAAGQFMMAMVTSHYYVVVFGFQLLCGILLLANRFVPLAVIILAAIITNILTFHIFMNPSGLPVALVTAVLWVLLFLGVRSSFDGVLRPRA